jgi:hypothetical protein
MKTKNAQTLPEIYYGLHMAPGVAEYRETPEDYYRIFIDEPVLKKMDKTFRGKPVYVDHVDQVDLENLQETADGYVVESFYNQADGKHWAKFIVVSDEAKQRIKEGWRLSNAYLLTDTGGGGQWHSVDYDKTVLNGEYEHLAIVDSPRYEESIILTPEEFKEYNEQKTSELLQIANSKKTNRGEKGMLKFFKRESVENSKDLENHMVVLPKSKREVSIITLVNEMDEVAMSSDEAKEVDLKDLVKLNEEEISVEELLQKYNQVCKENEEMKVELENMKKKNEEEEPEEDKEEKASNKDGGKNFKKLANASEDFEDFVSDQPLDLGFDKAARGQTRYGSK